jgi:hypothetical protein
VTLALLVLLGLCHPFWLTNWTRHDKKTGNRPRKEMDGKTSNPEEEVLVRHF